MFDIANAIIVAGAVGMAAWLGYSFCNTTNAPGSDLVLLLSCGVLGAMNVPAKVEVCTRRNLCAHVVKRLTITGLTGAVSLLFPDWVISGFTTALIGFEAGASIPSALSVETVYSSNGIAWVS